MKPWLAWMTSFLCALPVFAASTNAPITKSSLTLEESIDYAVHHNVQVLKAREEIRRTYGVIIETRGEMLPQFSATATWSRREPQTTEFFGNVNSFDGILKLTQVLYAGGAIRGSTKSAYLNREAAVLGFDRIVADTILAVRGRFYDVLYNEQLVKVREASVHLLEEQLDTTKRRFEAGTVPKFDVLRAEVELANARPPLIQARNDLRIAKMQLANLLAINTDPLATEAFPYVLIGELKYDEYNVDLQTCLKTAMERRAEIKELQKRAQARREELKIAYAGYKPRIQLYGQFEARNPQLGERVVNDNGTPFNTADDTVKQGTTVDLDPTIRGYSGGIEFSWDIFDGFSTHGRVVQARALYEAAKLDAEDKERDVSLDVRRSFSKLQEARETLESQKKAVEQGEESLRLAQARFNVGAGTQLDVLSAQTALTEARTNYAQALFNWNIAVSTLERAMGTNTHVANLDELRKKN